VPLCLNLLVQVGNLAVTPVLTNAGLPQPCHAIRLPLMWVLAQTRYDITYIAGYDRFYQTVRVSHKVDSVKSRLEGRVFVDC